MKGCVRWQLFSWREIAYLESQDFGLDEAKGLAVDLDEALALL